MTLDLHYLTDSVIPSTRANSVQVMKMCQAFAGLGADVTLHCRRPSRAVVEDEPSLFTRYGVTKSFSIQSHWTPAIRFADRIQYALQLWPRLRRLPSTSVLYSRDVMSLAALCRAGSIRARLVLEMHSPPPGPAWAAALRIILRHPGFERLVTISGALAQHYEAEFGSLLKNQILVAHDGADPAPPSVENSAGRQAGAEGKLTAGYIGSLRPGKGAEMVARLSEMLPDIDFHIVGGQPAEVLDLQRRASRPNLHFHGFLDQAGVAVHLGRYDIMLAPYQRAVLVGNGSLDIARWMSPLKLFEYMSHGKPVVCSDLPVLREILDDGESALLVDPDDPQSWLRAIRQLQADRPLRQSLGDAARTRFLTEYTWQSRAGSIISSLS